MADIELVIKIPKAYYELVIKRCNDPVLLNAFKNGTPLPKGHGKLIDANKIQFENNEFDTYSDYSKAFNAIYYAIPIVEADKGESER